MVIRRYGKISAVAAAWLIFFQCYTLAAQQHPVLEFTKGKVWIKGLDAEVLYTFSRYYNHPDEWKLVFPVATKESAGKPMIDGTYEVHQDAVSFTPRFPFARGVDYVSSFNMTEIAGNLNEVYLPKAASGVLTLEFRVQAEATILPRVEAVYPSADVLPENLLKIHIVFNSSMTTGEAYTRVKILDSKGKAIEKAFLIIDEELWDSDMKALTLLLDPGRIKRGLKANDQMGAPLKAGENYTLVIEPGWKNINGDYTNENFVKKFSCTTADRQKPDVGTWQIVSPPSVNTPLIIRTNEPLNYILLSDAFRISGHDGKPVEGKITVMDDESVISFHPTEEWINQHYTVGINPLLEDLAGNNLNRVFDQEVKTGAVTSPPQTTFTFNVKPLSR
jgi:hypothetical protein